MPADHGKHFTLYTCVGPNPWKVTMLLHELGFGDDFHPINLSLKTGETHQSPHVDLNPNGRNNDFVIWESGAILQYLVEKYDTEHKVSFEIFEDKMIANQYLHWQMSGQGPYYGQTGWFMFYHPEKNLESAIKRYSDQIDRFLSVLDKILEGKTWLVKDKFSYVDLSFVPWNNLIDWFVDEGRVELKGWREKYSNVGRWDAAIKARPAIKKACEQKAQILASNN
ncbi:glutathione S-transferase [Kalaharituber pfeilii]|nr:glutathione S-transferase [Kalaharituber pfeilii]